MSGGATFIARIPGWGWFKKTVGERYKWACGYRQMGLKYDDITVADYADTEEALRRLPEVERAARVRRLKRANDMVLKHQDLPREMWTKPEDDTRYLLPLLEQVKQERRDRELHRAGSTETWGMMVNRFLGGK